MKSLHCPHCDSPHTDVTAVRVSEKGNHVRRVRQCQGCHREFSTHEVVTGTKLHADQKQLVRVVDQLALLAEQAQRVVRGQHIEGKGEE